MYKGNLFRVIFILLLFLSVHSKAQEAMNSTTVETKSLQLYNDKNWKELIPYAKEAIGKGFDYYYIRIRLGIAYYEQKNYAKAVKQFEKALGFDAGDELAMEYLYYCFIYLEQYDDAMLLSKKFSKELAIKTGVDKLSAFSFVQLAGGVKIPNQQELYIPKTISLQTQEPTFQKTSQYNATDTTGYSNASFYQIAAGNSIAKRFSLFYAYSYFNQQQFHSRNDKKMFDRDSIFNNQKFHLHDELPGFHKDKDMITQNMFYLNANIPLKNNWFLSPAVHWLMNSNEHETDTSTFVSPLLFNHLNRPKILGIKSSPMNPTLNNYFVSSLLIGKLIEEIKISLGATYSNISGINRYQNSLSVNWYALGNNRFILGADAYFLENIDSAKSRLTVNTFISFRPVRKIVLAAGYLVGTEDNKNDKLGNNVIESNGYLINNSLDKTHSRFSLTGNVEIGKHIEFFVSYSYEVKTADYDNPTQDAGQGQPVPGQPPSTDKTEVPYFYNNFFVGITIKNFNKIIKH